MKLGRIQLLFLILVAGALATQTAWTRPSGHSAAETKDRASLLLSQPLPRLDGTHLVTTLVEVRYGPGESSPVHSHPCPVIVYVVAGSVKSQVQGGQEAIYKPGQSFYEGPGSIHTVSGNASHTESAKFVALFLCDHPTPLSQDVPTPMNEKGK